MEIKSRRYESPVTHPTLITQPIVSEPQPINRPIVCLRGARTGSGRTLASPIGFGWVRMIPMLSRR